MCWGEDDEIQTEMVLRKNGITMSLSSDKHLKIEMSDVIGYLNISANRMETFVPMMEKVIAEYKKGKQ